MNNGSHLKEHQYEVIAWSKSNTSTKNNVISFSVVCFRRGWCRNRMWFGWYNWRMVMTFLDRMQLRGFLNTWSRIEGDIMVAERELCYGHNLKRGGEVYHWGDQQGEVRLLNLTLINIRRHPSLVAPPQVTRRTCLSRGD